MPVTVVPLRTSTPWLAVKYGEEKSTRWRRSGRIDTPLTAKSHGQRAPATSLVKGNPTHWTRGMPRRLAISSTMSTSNPPSGWSRSSPSTNGGLGSSVAMVRTPGVRVRNLSVAGAAPAPAGRWPPPPPQAASSRASTSASSLPTRGSLWLPAQRTPDGTIAGALVGLGGTPVGESLRRRDGGPSPRPPHRPPGRRGRHRPAPGRPHVAGRAGVVAGPGRRPAGRRHRGRRARRHAPARLRAVPVTHGTPERRRLPGRGGRRGPARRPPRPTLDRRPPGPGRRGADRARPPPTAHPHPLIPGPPNGRVAQPRRGWRRLSTPPTVSPIPPPPNP